MFFFPKVCFMKVFFRKVYFLKVYFLKVYFLKVYFSKVYCKYASILGQNFFDPYVTQPKLFQTERTRRLAHLPSFCELVFTQLMVVMVVTNMRDGSVRHFFVSIILNWT